MGQQQLILIVIGIVIIGIGIAIANQLFDKNTENSYKNNIAYELVNLGTIAQQYYDKPLEMGGGNKSFIGWEIPGKLAYTPNASYTIFKLDKEILVMIGKPFDTIGYKWFMMSKVTKSNIVTTFQDQLF